MCIRDSAELVHEVLELHELVPGAADAHQEHGVVALVGDLVGEFDHPCIMYSNEFGELAKSRKAEKWFTLLAQEQAQQI